MSGNLFASGDLVWLWSPVVEKSVAPKFLEPWTGPYTVTKRLSDIKYEIQDQAKIVHFDRLKKATLNSVKQYQSEEKEVPERSAESDFDFEQVAPRTRNVPKRAKAVEAAPGVELADA